jgi:integrase
VAKITKRLLDAIRPDPAGRDKFVWDAGDGALKGFGVRVKPSGVASFIAQYRNKEGRTRRIVLAKVGTVTPDEGRELARQTLALVAKGSDPSSERRTARRGITVSELCDLYLVSAKGRIKDSTLAMDRSRVETHVKPTIGRISAASLTVADLERMKAAILTGKTAKTERNGRGGIATGGPGVAARTIGMMGTVLEYARARLKIIKENPAREIKKPPDGRQRRFLSLEEVARLGEAIAEVESTRGALAGLDAVKLLLLTGFRRMEALALPRSWVDARARCVRFADTKTGYQLRAIGADAVRLLDARPSGSSKWVFPAERGSGHFIGLPKLLDRLCAKAGLEGVTVHVLRHSFAATAAGMGYSELTIAGLLRHSVPGVTARYAHVPDAALVSAADRISAKIAAALRGSVDSANVLELTRAKAAS